MVFGGSISYIYLHQGTHTSTRSSTLERGLANSDDLNTLEALAKN